MFGLGLGALLLLILLGNALSGDKKAAGALLRVLGFAAFILFLILFLILG